MYKHLHLKYPGKEISGHHDSLFAFQECRSLSTMVKNFITNASAVLSVKIPSETTALYPKMKINLFVCRATMISLLKNAASVVR